ncbi:hypothetical protein AMTRI_Chr12g266890 [Amborella trichopoda]
MHHQQQHGGRDVWRLTILLCLAWVGTLLYGEFFAFSIIPHCSWPLTDRTSLGLPSRSLPLEAIQFYTDLYMRRCFRTSVLPFKPHILIFLGDHFDGGPHLSDEDRWQESLSRFRKIFDVIQRGRKSDIPVHYLSGNHDIGYGALHFYKPEVINRYDQEFGERNYRFNVGEVEFVAVDAQTLDGSQGNWSLAPWNFIKNLSSADVPLSPRILLTHIPLYRLDGTPCGLYRSSPIINQRIVRAGRGQEIMYQNYLSEDTSANLLNLLKPILVLSGHDHDQCTVTHQTPNGPVIEHTVGTFSWQQGNLYPSFMLLSVDALASKNSTNMEDIISTRLCFLPNQTMIYIWYLTLFVITILLLLLWPVNGPAFLEWCSSYLGSIQRLISNKNAKVKDDDEDCEFEMIWDAEGSMHLVKKAVKKASSSSQNGTQLPGRGNAVVRPTAKKQSVEAANLTSTNSSATDAKLEFGRGRRRFGFKRRLLLAIRMIMAIVAVNVPLYMMLLVKDWVD